MKSFPTFLYQVFFSREKWKGENLLLSNYSHAFWTLSRSDLPTLVYAPYDVFHKPFQLIFHRERKKRKKPLKSLTSNFSSFSCSRCVYFALAFHVFQCVSLHSAEKKTISSSEYDDKRVHKTMFATAKLLNGTMANRRWCACTALELTQIKNL